MKKLRWGVIGAGGIADRRTIPGMMLAKNAELIAVMDINAEQVEKIRQKYGAKRGYTKEEDLLADPEVDAVYIATPIVLHAKQAKLAADYGKDILIEKPLAMTSDEGQEVIDYCERKGALQGKGRSDRGGLHDALRFARHEYEKSHCRGQDRHGRIRLFAVYALASV